jgi:hypothetical protein
MPETNTVKTKSILGVHPAWALGIVAFLAAILIFQLL